MLVLAVLMVVVGSMLAVVGEGCIALVPYTVTGVVVHSLPTDGITGL